MGMASAFVGQADNPSAVWYNPAGITQLDGTQVSGGVIAVYPELTHETTNGTTEVSKRKIHLPIHLYATHKLNDNTFLGFGITPPVPTWGNMLQNVQERMWQQPWLAFYPGFCIFMASLAFNYVGDALRDALDPRLHS